MEKKEIIYGRNPVREFLKADRKFLSAELFVSEGAHGKIIDEIKGLARQRAVKICARTPDFFKSHDSSARHQGVLLEVYAAAAKATKDDPLKRIKGAGGVIIFLDHLTDPRNVGSIIRSAEALGASAVAMTEDRSAPLNSAAVKTSAGASSHIEIIKITNSADFLERAKLAGFWIIGASEHGTDTLSKIRGYRPCVIVIGSEGSGMKRLTKDKCDLMVSIPMKGKVSSLNASVAAGIILFAVLSD